MVVHMQSETDHYSTNWSSSGTNKILRAQERAQESAQVSAQERAKERAQVRAQVKA